MNISAKKEATYRPAHIKVKLPRCMWRQHKKAVQVHSQQWMKVNEEQPHGSDHRAPALRPASTCFHGRRRHRGLFRCPISQTEACWELWGSAVCSVFHAAPAEPNKSTRFLYSLGNVITGKWERGRRMRTGDPVLRSKGSSLARPLKTRSLSVVQKLRATAAALCFVSVSGSVKSVGWVWTV